MSWHVTILTQDGQEVLAHVTLQDEGEVIAYCTEARSLASYVQIWIKPPAGRSYSWD